MQQLLQDLKHALRVFRQHPVFAATIVAAIALGIGVNTAIFSVVNTVLLKPLPFPNPDALVQIVQTRDGRPLGFLGASPAKFMYWRAQTGVFQDVVAFRRLPLNYTGGDTPMQLAGTQVSEGYFRVYGAHFVEGRPFTAGEDRPGGPKVAIVSYDFWQQHLAGAANVIGRTLSLSADSYTVVGVVGQNFDVRDFGGAPDVWVPLQLDPSTVGRGNYLTVQARLESGVTRAQAQARLEASVPGFRERFPTVLGEQGGFGVLSVQQAIVAGNVRTELWVLLGAVGFVLLIACVNVANLLLVRATARRLEIAIRSALGAGRLRAARQLVTESVVLSLVGGVLGLVMGVAGMRALLAVNTAGLPRLGPHGSLMGLDWRVVTFTLMLSVGTGLLFGLVPGLVGSRTHLNTVIKDSGSRSGSGFRQNKTRSVLVMVEVGLAVVLLIGAALLIRTSIALGRVDPGFDTSRTLVMRTSLSGSHFRTSESVAQIERVALDRVRAIPGVASAAATCCVPLQGYVGFVFDIVGRPHDKGPFTGNAGFVTSSSGYFATFEIPLLRGRTFTDRDDADAPPVAVINEAMARTFWDKGVDPLQDRLLVGGGKVLNGEPTRQIVGIVGDVRGTSLGNNLGNDPFPTVYVPRAQLPDAFSAQLASAGPTAWVVRTRDEPTVVSASIQEEIRQATGLPVVGIQTLRNVVSSSLSRQRLNMLLMSIFGGSALLLAAIGIYGLMAYSVQQRRREIGIRMAMGAESSQVKRMVVRQGMLPVGIAIAAGLIASFYTVNVLSAFLFEVKPRDATVFVAVPFVLALTALVSVWVPAARASRVDPLDALRHE
jgi:putative ABC transport system permease protein